MSISLLLFSVAVVLAFSIIMNSFESENDFQRLKGDASRISEYLLSEGTPADWNATSVIRPGILSGKRINFTKAYSAMNITNASYAAIKSNLQTEYDFLVVFEHKNGTIASFQDYCAIGNDNLVEREFTPALACKSVNLTGISYDNMVKLTRFAAYDSSLVKMTIYMWD